MSWALRREPAWPVGGCRRRTGRLIRKHPVVGTKPQMDVVWQSVDIGTPVEIKAQNEQDPSRAGASLYNTFRSETVWPQRKAGPCGLGNLRRPLGRFQMRKLWIFTAIAPLALVAGCATNGDIDSVRQEIASVRATAVAADQKATAAQATADKAAVDASNAAVHAQMANQKADQIIRSMHK